MPEDARQKPPEAPAPLAMRRRSFFICATVLVLSLSMHPVLYGGMHVPVAWVQLAWAGAFAVSAWRLARRDPSPRSIGLGLARLHAGPGLALAALYWVDLRQLVVDGGPAFEPAWFLARLFGYGFGLPNAPSVAWLYSAVYAVLLGLALRRLARQGDELWLLLLVAIVLAALLGAHLKDLAGFLDRVADAEAFFNRERERLLAVDVAACAERGDGDRHVPVIGRADGDDVWLFLL